MRVTGGNCSSVICFFYAFKLVQALGGRKKKSTMMMNDNLMKASEAAINYKHPDNPAC
jgi:hypothetical protein